VRAVVHEKATPQEALDLFNRLKAGEPAKPERPAEASVNSAAAETNTQPKIEDESFVTA